MSVLDQRAVKFEERDIFLLFLLGVVSAVERLDTVIARADGAARRAGLEEPAGPISVQVIGQTRARSETIPLPPENDAVLLALLGVVSLQNRLKAALCGIKSAVAGTGQGPEAPDQSAPDYRFERFLR